MEKLILTIPIGLCKIKRSLHEHGIDYVQGLLYESRSNLMTSGRTWYSNVDGNVNNTKNHYSSMKSI